jgi:hypothetical protein
MPLGAVEGKGCQLATTGLWVNVFDGGHRHAGPSAARPAPHRQLARHRRHPLPPERLRIALLLDQRGVARRRTSRVLRLPCKPTLRRATWPDDVARSDPS